MSFSKISALAGVLALASNVAAHGTVTGVVADGVYYEGYSANFQYMAEQLDVVGWYTPEDQNNGFIAPQKYATSDIICHLGATNGQAYATVAAGGQVELQWTVWPSSHHGPVIDYLASCDGDCKTVDKTTLEFFKIDGVGLIDNASIPGKWASDQLIANNNSWTVQIPSDIAPGNYVLRHEIIALHSAGSVDGAQNYPQCVNLQVTGSGTATPSGVLGTALYTETDPGIEINIYQSLSAYVVPGPTLYSNAVSISQTGGMAITSIAPVLTGSQVAATTANAVETSAGVSSQATSAALQPSGALSSSVVVAEATSSSAQTPSTPVITSVASGSLVPTLIQTSGAPFQNTTRASKSACKAKTSGSARSTNVGKAATSVTSVLSEAASVTVATTTSASAAVSTSSALAASDSSSSSSDIAEPTGTTLGNLLSWISAFYDKFKGTTYNPNTVARRHARDVARAEMEKFDGKGVFGFEATGTEIGFAHPTGTGHAGHAHRTGSRGAKPTGFVAPTAGRHVVSAHFEPQMQ